jgi:hypothetical protein
MVRVHVVDGRVVHEVLQQVPEVHGGPLAGDHLDLLHGRREPRACDGGELGLHQLPEEVVVLFVERGHDARLELCALPPCG